MAESASLTLFPATKDQICVSRRRSHASWGIGLTVDQFLTKEAHLDLAQHAIDGKFTAWVLAPRNDPTTLEFKCACETFRRKALVRAAGSSEIQEAVGYTVASVFTPFENRRKGYARHMMSLLHWVLAPRSALPAFPDAWGTPPSKVDGMCNAQFSILYSDVGEFYKAAGPDGNATGWTIRDPLATIWNVSTMPNQSGSDVEGITWLGEPEVQELWKRDAELIKEDMGSAKSSRTLFTFSPDAGVGGYSIQRTLFFLSSQSFDMPKYWGVSLSPAGSDANTTSPTFATFTLDVRPPPLALVVTRIRATKSSFPRLVSALIKAAQDNGMERIEIWNLPEELVPIALTLGGTTGVRDDHLNAFKWYGSGKDEEFEWLFNEKFAWM